MKKFFPLLCVLSIISAQSFSQAQSETDNNKPINPAYLNTSVKPTVDFYEYANGSWLSNNPIPPAYSRWGSWNVIINNNQDVLKQILEDASGNSSASKGSNVQKLGDLYYTAMDTVAIENAGMNPLKEDLARIDAIQSKEDLQKVFSYFKKYRSGGLFFLFSNQDDKNSDNVVLNIFQGGLGLPDRDYYFRDDERSKKLRDKYHEFMIKLLTLSGNDAMTASNIANKVYDIETRLAEASMKRVDMREAEATYHLMSLNDLKAISPNISWNILFAELGLDNSRFEKGINVAQPDFLKEVNRMVQDISLEDWKNYLKWNVINNAADILSSDFADADFDFYSRTLRGVEEQQPRWKESLKYVENAMGEPLGQLFIEKKFTPETKAKALEMVNNIKESFGERLKKNEWMSDATKQEALKKLANFTVKIGYTDKWKDFSGLNIDRTSFYNNMMNANAYGLKLNLDKIGKPVQRQEWGMFPQTVNAQYSQSKNDITFPAGIMQPPFYDPDADDAVNYGGIGAVIGHEMTHGFDDQGRKYDGDGNLKDWWTEEDAAKFKERADKLVAQYNSYVAIDSLHVNGELTLGENIADLGGAIVAYYALQKRLEGKEQPLIDGFTPEQRFFLSFAQVWRLNSRPESLRLQVNTDPHSPERFRVIGTVSNMEEFMEAFDGNPGDPMVNTGDNRVVIW
ncbi:MAG: M13 family metallopeptidase [Ignavibacteria bacterium]